MSIALNEIEERLKPFGHADTKWHDCSISGFIGENESLSEIICEDKLTLQRIGISYNDFASSINEIIYSDKVMLQERYRILRENTCGEQRCPWGDDATDLAYYMILYDIFNYEHKNFVNLWKKSYGLLPNKFETFNNLFCEEPVIIISGIMPHLISEHMFFQGKESIYRIDPEQLVRYLGIL